MLIRTLQNRYQPSDQYLAGDWGIRCLRQTSKAVVSVLLCLSLTISNTSCLALEKHSSLFGDNYPVRFGDNYLDRLTDM